MLPDMGLNTLNANTNTMNANVNTNTLGSISNNFQNTIARGSIQL